MDRKIGVVYEFNCFRVDTLNRKLTRDGEAVPLTPLAFNTLLFLIENRQRLISRTELLASIWPDTSVDDPNLAVMISVVRKALGDSGRAQTYIATVAKSGYRFLGEVREEVEREGAAASETDTPSAAPPAPPGFASMKLFGWTATWMLVLIAGTAFLAKQHLAADRLASANGQRATHEVRAVSASLPALFAKPAAGAMPVSEEDSNVLYLKGRYCWSRGTEKGLKQSIAYFRSAIAADPRNARAYAGLADAYQSLATWSVQSSAIAYRQAKDAADRAIYLDDSLSQSHSALGMIALVNDWNFPVAKREFLRAVELGPQDPIAHQRLGAYLAANGRLKEALRETRLARDLDPLSLNIGIQVGRMFYYSRQYPEAIAEYRKVIDLDPRYSVAHYYLGMTYFVQGDFKNAALELGESSKLVNDREPLAFGLYAGALARRGDVATAESVLSSLIRRAANEYVCPLSIGLLYLNLGQRDEALKWVEKMFQDHSLMSVYSAVDPLFDPLRSDPRFLALRRGLTVEADLQTPLLSDLVLHR